MMKTVIVRLATLRIADVLNYLNEQYPAQTGPPWFDRINNYAALCIQLKRIHGVRDAAECGIQVSIDFSGRLVGRDQVEARVVRLLRRFGGFALDWREEHRWTLEELQAGMQLDGLQFFDLKGYYERKIAESERKPLIFDDDDDHEPIPSELAQRLLIGKVVVEVNQGTTCSIICDDVATSGVERRIGGRSSIVLESPWRLGAEVFQPDVSLSLPPPNAPQQSLWLNSLMGKRIEHVEVSDIHYNLYVRFDDGRWLIALGQNPEFEAWSVRLVGGLLQMIVTVDGVIYFGL